MLRRVAVIALDRVAPFELGVACEVFGTDRTADGFPGYDFAVCTADGGPVRTSAGFSLVPHADLGPVAEADLVVAPAYATAVSGAGGGAPVGPDGPRPQGSPDHSAPPTAVLHALRAAAERGAWLLSVCTGAFLLGEAGLLDGRRCTTHWRHADALAERFPLAQVACDALYVTDGNVLTSAGTAAGIDACLHLVRQEHGSAVATKLARRMVVPPHRDGGQTQYIEAPIPRTPDAPTLEPLLTWLIANLHRQLAVEDLAGRVNMAPRTFARRFRAETGTTPHDWITNQRVLLARRLLEDSALSVEAIAGRTGFGDAAALRHHFTRRVGATPQAYRTTFRDRSMAS